MGRRGSGGASLRTFPAYGALLRVGVPAQLTEIEVRAEPYEWGWAFSSFLLGLAAIAGLLVCVWRARSAG